MRELLEQGYGIVGIGAVAGVGLLCRWILLFYYSGIGQACKEFGRTKNKTVSYIREDLKNRKNANLGIKSAMIYTECRLAERKVLGIRLGVLETVAEQSLLLVLLSGVLIAFLGGLLGCEGKTSFLHLFFCGVITFLVLVADLFTGLKEKHRRVRLQIRDYIENMWAFGAECAGTEEYLPEKEKKRRAKTERNAEKKVGEKKKKTSEETKRAKEKKSRRGEKKEARKQRQFEKERQRLEKKVSHEAKKRRKHGKAQEEKRRLTEELLRERRQLEARHFAQQRNIAVAEQEEKEPVTVAKECGVPTVSAALPEHDKEQERAREEAAATEAVEVTYETLLGEVLAEYLA